MTISNGGSFIDASLFPLVFANYSAQTDAVNKQFLFFPVSFLKILEKNLHISFILYFIFYFKLDIYKQLSTWLL